MRDFFPDFGTSILRSKNHFCAWQMAISVERMQIRKLKPLALLKLKR